MKKTEKIEIRLSHEEKAGLSKLAEEEGRSVSDLVRGLIDRYMSLHKDRLPRKTRWGLLSAIGIGGILLGHLGTYFIAQSHSHLEIYQLGVRFHDSTISIPITRTEGETTHFILPNPAGDIKLRADVKKGDGILSVVEVSMCQIQGAQCQDIAKPKLTFNGKETSRLRFNYGEKDIELSLYSTSSR